jgi:hypothetical protein
MSLSLMRLPLLMSLAAEDWLRDDRFPQDPLIGRFRVIEIYPRPLRLLNPEIRIVGPVLHLNQQVSIEHVGEDIYFGQRAQEYRFIFHGLPPSATADNTELPPPAWQPTALATYTTSATVIDDVTPSLLAQFGARPDSPVYIAAFGQPGPEAWLFLADEGDLIWQIFVDIKPEVQLHTTSLTITFRLKRET